MQREADFLRELQVFRDFWIQESLIQEVLSTMDRERYLLVTLRVNVRALQVLPELHHVVGLYRGDVEGFEQVYVLGVVFRDDRSGAALEGEVPAFEAYSAPKELDDLGSLTLADVEQTHIGDPPARPTLDELLRPDEDIYLQIFIVYVTEQATGEDVLLHDYTGNLVPECLLEPARVPDEDEPEILLRARNLQAQLAFGALYVRNVQRAAGLGVKDLAQHVFEDLPLPVYRIFEVAKSSGKGVPPITVLESGCSFE